MDYKDAYTQWTPLECVVQRQKENLEKLSSDLQAEKYAVENLQDRLKVATERADTAEKDRGQLLLALRSAAATMDGVYSITDDDSVEEQLLGAACDSIEVICEAFDPE